MNNSAAMFSWTWEKRSEQAEEGEVGADFHDVEDGGEIGEFAEEGGADARQAKLNRCLSRFSLTIRKRPLAFNCCAKAGCRFARRPTSPP